MEVNCLFRFNEILRPVHSVPIWGFLPNEWCLYISVASQHFTVKPSARLGHKPNNPNQLKLGS